MADQRCACAEIDGRDVEAWHLQYRDGAALGGCLRVFAPGPREDAARIGRFATAPTHRGSGLGHAMMREALRFCAERFSGADVVLSAQAHLQRFYARYGFEPESELYLEDDIPHVDMRRPAGGESAC